MNRFVHPAERGVRLRHFGLLVVRFQTPPPPPPLLLTKGGLCHRVGTALNSNFPTQERWITSSLPTILSNTMMVSGDNPFAAASRRMDRSRWGLKSSKFRNSSRIPLVLACEPTMAFAINTTKPLPTMPTFKRRARKRRDHPDTMTTSSQPSVLAPDPVDARTTNQMGLLEAVSEPGREQPVQFAAQCTPTLKQGSAPGLQRSTAAGEHQSPGRSADESDRRFAYNEYGPPALGQSGEGQGTTAEQVEDLTRTDSPSTRSNAPAMPVELTLRLSLRERRPKIQLTIPRTKSKTYAAIPHDDHPGQRRPASRGATKGVSPPSTTSRSRGDAGNSPTKLSVVSPLSTMEMPQPRRPFTTFSFEGLTDDPANRETLLSKSTFSSSSEDAGEHDDQSSCYSSHSSISSFASDPTAAKLVVPNAELPVVSPTAAGGFDAGRSASKSPAPSQVMRSLPCRNDGANRNKPLPPAPGPDEVKSLNYSAHPFGRTSSTTAGRKNRGLLPLSRQSTMSVSSRVSLRSKYTPTDFEPGDNALQRSSSKNLAPASPADPVSPTLSQAELELEAHLCAIDEYGPVDGPEVPLVDDPLQIRRGPMHMQPSRKPPSPQPSQVTAERLLPDGKAHPAKAATHVAMQMRPGKDSDRTLGTRVSAPAVGSKDKANRVLGRSGQATTTGRQPSAGPPGEPSESPHSGRNISMDDAETPVTDRSPLISDAAFEEVRQRLEFLSPKSDALQDFLEFHQQNFPDAGVTPPPRQEASTGTRSIDSSCRPTEPSKSPRRAPPPHLPTRPHPFTPAGRTPRAGPRARRDPRPRPGRSQTTSDVPTGDVPVPSPGTSVQQSRAGEDEERMISAAAAEQVLLCVLENLDHLQDLFAAATVSRGFYRTFKRHELRLMKNALYRMSPAAWELREMSPPVPAGEGAGPGSTSAYTPSLYLQSYMKDMYTMVALKSMILVHCESFLRVDTITALAGAETVRASQIDDAFWRVWTFCRLFGCGTKREDDIVGQMDWLRGGVQARQQARSMRPRDQSSEGDGNDTSFNRGPAFGQGNHGGLGAEELYDMTEIWTCLGVLVGGFQGKRELAREFGVFDNANIPVDNVEKEDAALGIALDPIDANKANEQQRNGPTTSLLWLRPLFSMSHQLQAPRPPRSRMLTPEDIPPGPLPRRVSRDPPF